MIELVLLLLFYCMPSLIAVNRERDPIGPVVVVNLFLGWTILGWIIALAMAYGRTKECH